MCFAGGSPKWIRPSFFPAGEAQASNLRGRYTQQQARIDGRPAAQGRDVTLIPLASHYLRPYEPLPFAIRDGSGRLLLAAGARIERPDLLAVLKAGSLFIDESESDEWRRRLVGKVDVMCRQNASLARIADARPERDTGRGESSLGIGEQWDEIATALDAAVRDLQADGGWLSRLTAVHGRALGLAQRRPDASLYHLVFEAGHSTERYSSRHALLCMLIVRQVAVTLGWSGSLIGSLDLAALTMNVGMRKLQDLLAVGTRAVTVEMRAEIDGHAQRSAELLAECGVADAAWIEIVRRHHDDSLRSAPIEALTEVEAATRALRRVDVFAAKLSRRATRAPMSPIQAAREACLGEDGKPDEIGSALLKSVGLYPPGSFVALASGEVGIVIARGRRANLPVVAALVSANGSVFAQPLVRDAVDPRHAVKAAVPPGSVRVRPPHELLMRLR